MSDNLCAHLWWVAVLREEAARPVREARRTIDLIDSILADAGAGPRHRLAAIEVGGGYVATGRDRCTLTLPDQRLSARGAREGWARGRFLLPGC